MSNNVQEREVERELEFELVKKYQEERDDDAFTLLYKRYDRRLLNKAQSVHKQYPMFDVNEFHSYFAQKFLKAVETFDLSKGVPFGAFLNLKLSKAAFDYVKRKLYCTKREEDGYLMPHKINRRINQIENDGNPMNIRNQNLETGEGRGTNLPEQISDDKSDYDYQLQANQTDLYKYIASHNDTHARVIALVAEGYSYEESASIVGKTGSTAALKMWTKRVVDKSKDYAKQFYEEIDMPVIVEG